jgi:hypothetical protein
MAKRNLFCCPDNDTTAHFNAWVNEMDAALISYGWTRSGDTGEASMPTSVARATTTNTYPIWVVYKMGDSLQSTTAVYMRIDYGTGGNGDTPSVKIQIAIGGTNGSGTLTGSVGTQMIQSGQSPATTNAPFRTSGSSSSFRVMAWSRYNGQAWIFAVERDKDSSGADTSSGVSMAAAWANNNAGGVAVQSQYITSSSLGLVDTTRLYGLLSSTTPSQTWHSQTGVAPLRTSLGPFRNPMLGILMTARNDFVDGSTNNVTVYGTSHVYLMGCPTAQTPNLNGISSDCGLGILWE